MALINCPECGKEISDSNAKCPYCGYSIKGKKKWLLPVIIGLVVILGGGVLSYFLYFKPNSIMNQAENLIAREKYAEADILLASIPSSARKEKIIAQICIAEAREAMASGNYSLAEAKMKSISPDSVPQELLEEINKQKAIALLGQGRYVEADQYYASLEQTEEVISLRKELFYESRVLQCALRTKSNLLFPDSMIISEAICLSGGTAVNKSLSDDKVQTKEYKQPTIVLHYQAKSRGGSMTDGYQRYVWDVNSNSYSQCDSVDSLKADEKTPSYVDLYDADEKREYLAQQLEISMLGLDLMSSRWEMSLEDDQLDRVNSALQGSTTKQTDFIANNEIVPLPTPEIVNVTPKPE